MATVEVFGPPGGITPAGAAQAQKNDGQDELAQPAPDSPEYWGYLTKAIFAVGLCKCITPAALILAGAIFLGIDVSERTQDCLEQVAGGLLIYTWGAKCMVPIQENFLACLIESKKFSKQVSAGVGITVMVGLLVGPLVYLATEGHDFSKVDGGIMFFGVMNTGEGAQCNDDGTAKLSVSVARLCAAPKPTRPGLVHSPQCPGDTNSAQNGAVGFGALIPYFIGFALDAIMLVMVEPEEELVGMYTKMKTQGFKSVAKDLIVAPIAFALDNLLTGAGCCTVVLAAAKGSKGGAFGIFIIFALMTVVGVFVAFALRAFIELCDRNGCSSVGLWVKFVFLLAAALSFLDNGTDLVKSGLTFWVGVGCAIGWLLFAGEALDQGDDEEEVSGDVVIVKSGAETAVDKT